VRFLVPLGGDIGPAYGVLTNFLHKSVPLAIKQGKPWAGDNCAFGNGFDPDRFFPWLERMRPFRQSCLFIVIPDAVGDPVETRRLFDRWADSLAGWPLAFVAQDGQEGMEYPDPGRWSVLFLGGRGLTDEEREAGAVEWKDGDGAVRCIQQAQRMGKKIHVGRVNWGGRYNRFRVLPGSEQFTCDGTRTRFDGAERTLNAWLGYEAQQPLLRVTSGWKGYKERIAPLWPSMAGVSSDAPARQRLRRHMLDNWHGDLLKMSDRGRISVSELPAELLPDDIDCIADDGEIDYGMLCHLALGAWEDGDDDALLLLDVVAGDDASGEYAC